ncbi:MAG: hypothetical protein JXB39_05315 [Deltaproteobacteria bacterium]|nr:hypothetical protein [Deltaproteobacteria bacterium]
MASDPQEPAGNGRARPIDLRVRRQAGVELRYTLRFTVLDGRGLVMLDSDVLVHEADLRTNGILTDLEPDQVLSGQFVFVSSSGTENRKYRTWDRDRATLEALPPGSNWTHVEPTPVSEDPFFILDTDNMDIPFPWRDLVPSGPEGASNTGSDSLPEIGASGLQLLPTDPDEETTSHQNPSAPAPSEAPAPTREQIAFQAVRYLRDELVRERAERSRLEGEIRRLEEEIRTLRPDRDSR